MPLSEATKTKLIALETILRESGVERPPGETPAKFIDEVSKLRTYSPTMMDCLENRKEAEQFIAGLWGYM